MEIGKYLELLREVNTLILMHEKYTPNEEIREKLDKLGAKIEELAITEVQSKYPIKSIAYESPISCKIYSEPSKIK